MRRSTLVITFFTFVALMGSAIALGLVNNTCLAQSVTEADVAKKSVAKQANRPPTVKAPVKNPAVANKKVVNPKAAATKLPVAASPTPIEEEAEDGGVNLDVEPKPTDPGYSVAISATWQLAMSSLRGGDHQKTTQALDDLIVLRDQANIQSLDEYSLVLLYWAKELAKKGRKAEASSFVSRALQLSPAAPLVEAAAIPLIWSMGTRPTGYQTPNIKNAILYHAEFTLRLINGALYPLLWALTIATFIATVFFLAAYVPQLVDGLGRWIPIYVRGVLAPAAAGVVLIGPLFCSPLLCLSLWGVVALFLVQKRNALGIFVGLVLCCWAVVMPVREHLHHWLRDDRVLGMLRVLSGSFRPQDKLRIDDLRDQLPDYSVVRFARSQLLLREGRLDEAERELDEYQNRVGVTSWGVAVRGIIAFMRGDVDKAAQLHEQAEGLGIKTAAFFFNFSKVRFAQYQFTAAVDLLSRATNQDKNLVYSLVDREKIHKQRAIGMISLPTLEIIQAGSMESGIAKERIQRHFESLVPLVGRLPLLIAGLILSVLGLMKNTSAPVSSSKREMLGGGVGWVVRGAALLVPGCSLMLRGYGVWGIAVLILFTSAALPVLGWPKDVSVLFSLFPQIKGFYLSILAVAVIANFIIVLDTSKEEL